LIYIFLCCPVFAKVSSADDHGMPSPWELLTDRFESVLRFTMQNLPDWIRDYKASDVQANKEKQKEIREDIRDTWAHPPFVY